MTSFVGWTIRCKKRFVIRKILDKENGDEFCIFKNITFSKIDFFIDWCSWIFHIFIFYAKLKFSGWRGMLSNSTDFMVKSASNSFCGICHTSDQIMIPKDQMFSRRGRSSVLDVQRKVQQQLQQPQQLQQQQQQPATANRRPTAFVAFTIYLIELWLKKNKYFLDENCFPN